MKPEDWLQEIPPGCGVINLERETARSAWRSFRCAFDARFMGVDGLIAREWTEHRWETSFPSTILSWVHSLRIADAFRLWKWPRSVMDIDDIPSTYIRTELENTGGAVDDPERGFAGKPRTASERLLGDRFSAISVCSEADREYLGLGQNVHVIPNGFEKPERLPPRRVAQPPRFGFIGTMEFKPNAAGMRWFAAQCWPRVKKLLPDARFRLIGTGSEDFSTTLGTDIDGPRVLWTKPCGKEIATWSAMVVPLQLGAGTPVKIAEAFSRRCPIVSTSFGCLGYNVEHEREMLVANSAQELATRCISAAAGVPEKPEGWPTACVAVLEEWGWDAAPTAVVWSVSEACLRARS